jgi:tight adherence protein B
MYRKVKIRIPATPKNLRKLILLSFGIILGTTIGTLFTNSLIIGMAFGSLSSIGPSIYLRRKSENERKKLQKLWPEILDHLISGLNSGLSLSQTIAALSNRGPKLSRPIFRDFEDSIKSGFSFNRSLLPVRNRFQDAIADQVCEVLEFARTSGSRDSSLTLRTLASYIRSDLALRNEISAKHGWIKNAAILAGLAPWILLIILSTQRSTIMAYSSPPGIAILGIGVLLTLIAYFWMDKVGRLSVAPRIFNFADLPINNEFKG